MDFDGSSTLLRSLLAQPVPAVRVGVVKKADKGYLKCYVHFAWVTKI